MKNRGYITITGLENKDEQPIVSVKIENGNVWMTKHELARLFGVFVQTIDANVRSIFQIPPALRRRRDHNRETEQKSIVTYYNLEAIIFLSFRINTYCTKLFREGTNPLQVQTPARKSPKSLLLSIPTATGLLSSYQLTKKPPKTPAPFFSPEISIPQKKIKKPPHPSFPPRGKI